MGKYKGIKHLLLRRNWSYDQINALSNVRKYFFQVNWIKTLWFNFAALPVNQAIKMPFVIAYNTKIRSIGKIELPNQCYVGMISIGVIKIDQWESRSTTLIISNYGTWSFLGRSKIHPGARVNIKKNAVCSFGERVSIGANTKIICAKSINMGHDVQVSWESQVFDTDFHFFKTLATNKIHARIKPVEIGDECFVGNRATIGKGTILPQGSTVSCCSKVSGNFSEFGNNLLIIGNPAEVVGKGYLMGNGWFPEIERAIAQDMEE